MNAPTELEVAREDVAARLKIDAEELTRLLRIARGAGWKTAADQLAAVLVAGHAAHAWWRGAAVHDPIGVAIRRDGPRHQQLVVARVAACLARHGNNWRAQCRRDRRGGRRAGAGRKPRGGGAAGCLV